MYVRAIEKLSSSNWLINKSDYFKFMSSFE